MPIVFPAAAAGSQSSPRLTCCKEPGQFSARQIPPLGRVRDLGSRAQAPGPRSTTAPTAGQEKESGHMLSVAGQSLKLVTWLTWSLSPKGRTGRLYPAAAASKRGRAHKDLRVSQRTMVLAPLWRRGMLPRLIGGAGIATTGSPTRACTALDLQTFRRFLAPAGIQVSRGAPACPMQCTLPYGAPPQLLLCITAHSVV